MTSPSFEAGADPLAAALAAVVPESPPSGVGERLFEDVRARLLGISPLPRNIGRFTVLEELGRGGMGTVFAVYDPRLNRKIALKSLLSFTDTEDLLAEARALAKVRHPHIVEVYDVGVDAARGQAFIVMERVLGGTLRSWLEGRSRSRSEILALFDQVAAGLATAHGCGVIHRDLKPANVLVDEGGHAKVTDFGLALVEVRSGEPPSESCVPSGTRPYMAPEVLRSEPATERSDQYAWFVTLHEALVGHRPPGGHPASELPRRLRRVFARGLAPDPRKRFASMDAARHALGRATRHRNWAWLGAAGLVGSMAALASTMPPEHHPALGVNRGLGPLGGFEASARLDSARRLNRAGKWDAANAQLRRAFFAGQRTPKESWSARAALGLTESLGASFGRIDEAQQWSRTARAALDRVDPPSPTLELWWSRSAASTSAGASDREGAILDLQAAVDTAQNVLGSDDAEVARAHTNLGSLLIRQGRREEARLHFDNALRIMELQFGPDDTRVATVLRIRSEADDIPEARAHLERALEIQLAHYGEAHPRVVSTYHDLGSAMLHSGDAQGALTNLRRAKELCRVVYRPDHPLFALIGHTMSQALLDLKRLEEARVELDAAIDIRERAEGLESRQLASSLSLRSAIAAEQGHWDDARRYAERAVTLSRAHEDVSLGWSLASLAQAWVGLGQPERAMAAIEEATEKTTADPNVSPPPELLADLRQRAHDLIR